MKNPVRILLSTLFPLLLAATPSQAAPKPNIILIVADDLGWTDLASTGSKIHETPFTDSLASEGMTFTNGYAAASNCAPSRACLITGQYVPRHGMTTVAPAARGKTSNRKLLVPEPVDSISEKPVSLAELLKSADYATCMAGKWHVSKDPTQFGFDTNFGGNHTGNPRGGYFSPYKNPELKDGPKGEHLPARLGNDVSQWITEHKDEPFFVYLPFYSVHTPIQAREDLTEKYRKKFPELSENEAKYAAMVEAMDLAVGKVLTTLDEQKLSDNTIIIFTSDNGPYGPISDAQPLRGSKGMFYEGGIRVPFIVRWPGKVEAGSSNDTPVINVDLFPTFAALAAATLPDQSMDGVNLLPAFTGEKIGERDLFWHFPAYLQPYGKQKEKEAHDPNWRSGPCSVIRSGDWKLIEYFEDGSLELFNLADDIGEKNSLTKKNPEKCDQLYAKLKAWQKSTKAQIPTESNPAYKKK